MSENKPNRKGIDFLTGALYFIIAAVISIPLMFAAESAAPLVLGVVVLIVGAIISFVKQRPLIGVGILAMLLISPLLLVGSCFALFALNA